jgi:Ca2+-binding RTX toxin-like protein
VHSTILKILILTTKEVNIMAKLTIKTASGFNMNDAFALNNRSSIIKNPTSWVEKDSVTGEKHIWFGTGFTYDASGKITSGTATKLVTYDAAGAAEVVVQFPTAWNFATRGAPSNYATLLSGNDVLTGGAGDDVLLGFAGDDVLGGGGGAGCQWGLCLQRAYLFIE